MIHIRNKPDIDLVKLAESKDTTEAERKEILAELSIRGTVTAVLFLTSAGKLEHAALGNRVRAMKSNNPKERGEPKAGHIPPTDLKILERGATRAEIHNYADSLK